MKTFTVYCTCLEICNEIHGEIFVVVKTTKTVKLFPAKPFYVFLCRERINKLLLVFADELKEVTEMTHGNIAAIVGLKNVCSVSSQL